MLNDYLYDTAFLKELDKNRNKFLYVKIIVLDMQERPISSIEGRVQQGASINIDGSSSMRRTCSINFIALEEENDLTDIDNLLSINKKIKIEVGVLNNFPNEYDNDIFWFPQGVFVIEDPSISNTSDGCSISLSCKDKMAFLNGDCGGAFPAAVSFDKYEQAIGSIRVEDWPLEPNNYTVYDFGKEVLLNGESSQYWSWTEENGFQVDTPPEAGETKEIQNFFYDIIQTVVCNYGGEGIDKIIINDIPRKIKQMVFNLGPGSLFYNPLQGEYSIDQSLGIDSSGNWVEFEEFEECGYVYTDFTWPGDSELVASPGETVTSILDQIVEKLYGNYEYFYDIDGNFVFQEKKNYLNVSYIPVANAKTVTPLNYDAPMFKNYFSAINNLPTDELREHFIIETINNKKLLEGKEFTNFNITYPKENGTDGKILVSYISDTWTSVNNFFLIGENNYLVDYNGNKKSVYNFNTKDGLIIDISNTPSYSNIKNDFHVWGKQDDNSELHYHLVIKQKPKVMNTYKVKLIDEDQIAVVSDDDPDGIEYTPTDWRVEIYLQGRLKQLQQRRPDIYEQEILDLFPLIYGFREDTTSAAEKKIVGEYKEDITKGKMLPYFIDYLEPLDNLVDYSVDMIGSRIETCQEDNIVAMFKSEVPDVVIFNNTGDTQYNRLIKEECDRIGQKIDQVSPVIFSHLSVGKMGITAQDAARELLYQYTDYNSAISFSCVPIYYLEPNTRITVYDRKANVYGDYIIQSISRPIDSQGTMSITATRALERV